MRKKLFIISILLLVAASAITLAAEEKKAERPDPAIVGMKMWDFELPTLEGKTFKLSDYKGKNLILIFPRVSWGGGDCYFCGYQYMEWVNAMKHSKFEEKLNAKLVYVFPFDKKYVNNWLAKMPEFLKSVHDVVYPKDFDKFPRERQERILAFRKMYFGEFLVNKDKTQTPMIILLDAERKVSKKLDIFRTEWGGGKGDQNIPMIMVLDGDGVVRYKYVSQNTLDRPKPSHVLSYIERFLK